MQRDPYLDFKPMLPSVLNPRRARLLAAAAALALLAACESVRGWAPTFIQPYRPDVPQGNIITKEMVEQLRPGMTRDQVRFLLGTPLVASVFHADRWDYVYSLKRGKGTEFQTRKMAVYFKDGKLERFDAEPMPPETMADNLILGRNPKDVPKAPPSQPAPQVTLPASK